MPFTPSHASVAPLLQRLIRPLGFVVPTSALVIGTMSPDFEYLIRLAPGGGAWHTKVGLLEFCLPAGLAAWLIFHMIVGPAMVRLLPDSLNAAPGAQTSRAPIPRLIPGAGLAILIGAMSHDFWDSFTHEQGWGVRQLPILRRAIPIGPHEWIRWYSILQYASSVLGLVLVVLIACRWALKLKADARPMSHDEIVSLVRVVGLLVVVSLLGAVINGFRARPFGLSWTIGYVTVGGMSALVVGLVGYGIFDWLRHSGRLDTELSRRPSGRPKARYQL